MRTQTKGLKQEWQGDVEKLMWMRLSEKLTLSQYQGLTQLNKKPLYPITYPINM